MAWPQLEGPCRQFELPPASSTTTGHEAPSMAATSPRDPNPHAPELSVRVGCACRLGAERDRVWRERGGSVREIELQLWSWDWTSVIRTYLAIEAD